MPARSCSLTYVQHEDGRRRTVPRVVIPRGYRSVCFLPDGSGRLIDATFLVYTSVAF